MSTCVANNSTEGASIRAPADVCMSPLLYSPTAENCVCVCVCVCVRACALVHEALVCSLCACVWIARAGRSTATAVTTAVAGSAGAQYALNRSNSFLLAHSHLLAKKSSATTAGEFGP